MKKSKKALLWTIVPVLGVSSGVAGAVAGVTNQKTSVDTNNVATSSTATTMATKSSNRAANQLKIIDQTREVLTYSDRVTSEHMTVNVSGASSEGFLNYKWEVKQGSGWRTVVSTGRQTAFVDVPKGITSVKTWVYRCTITDRLTKASIVSDEIKFTVAPNIGIYVNIKKQPVATKTVYAGDEVTLETEAVAEHYYKAKEIGYQWFEYDINKNEFTLIEGADKSTYKFTAPRYSETKTKNYVCRYYFKDNKNEYLSESKQSIITINKSEEEKITIEKLKATETSIEVGESTTLSVEASSNVTATKDLTYQWYKVGSDDRTFEVINDATSSTYTYTATEADDNKELIFCVLVGGSTRDGVKYHWQSDNLKVKVGLSSETTGSIGSETLASKIEVSSSVTTNQASVRSTFYPVSGIRTPQYSVDVKGVESASKLTYEWYYVGRDKKENLISRGDSNVLTTNKSLYQKVYNDNSNHKVGIMCKIYQGEELVKIVDQSTDSRFYMTVVIARR